MKLAYAACACVALIATAPSIAQIGSRAAAASARGERENASRDAAEKANQQAAPAEYWRALYDAPAAAKDQPLPIEAFIARPAVATATLSPDGKRIAAVRRANGQTQLVMLDAQNPAVGARAISLGASTVTMLEWASNDRLLYAAGADHPQVKADATGTYVEGAPRLYAVNADLSNLFMFFPDTSRSAREYTGPAEIFRIDGNASQVLMPVSQSRKRNLLKVDVVTGVSEKVADGEATTRAWFVDRNGAPAIRVDQGKRASELIYQMRTSAPGQPLTWRKGPTVSTLPGSAYPSFRPIAASATPGQFYVIARPNGADTLGVHLYDVATDAYVKPLFVKAGFDVVSAAIDPGTGAYLGAFYWDDGLKFEFADAKANEIMGAINGYFEGKKNIEIADYAAASGRVLVRVFNASEPGEYHIVDLAAGAVNIIGRTMPGLDPAALGVTYPASYKARDGRPLKAYLTMPVGVKPGAARTPAVVLLHEGPGARDGLDYDPLVQFLASRGYAVLQPQVRGSGGFGLAAINASKGKWLDDALADIIDGAKVLTDQGIADPARMCVVGSGLGGLAALRAAQDATVFKCAASISGPGDIVKLIAHETGADGREAEIVTLHADLFGDEAARAAASPALSAAKVAAPVLLLHGKTDTAIPPSFSKDMQAALLAAGKPVELVEIEHGGDVLVGRGQKLAMKSLEAFLGQHIGGKVVATLADPVPPVAPPPDAKP